MIDAETKEQYIKSLEAICSDKKFVKLTENFLNDETALNEFLLGLFVLLAKYENYKIKATGFDKLKNTKEKYKDLEDLKNAAEQITEVKTLILPVTEPQEK
jgi:hypothetical protein